ETQVHGVVDGPVHTATGIDLSGDVPQQVSDKAGEIVGALPPPPPPPSQQDLVDQAQQTLAPVNTILDGVGVPPVNVGDVPGTVGAYRDYATGVATGAATLAHDTAHDAVKTATGLDIDDPNVGDLQPPVDPQPVVDG